MRTVRAPARAVSCVVSGAARFGAAVAVMLALAAPAGAQSTDALLRDIERLRQDIADLQRSVYRGAPPPDGATQAVAPAAAGDLPPSLASRVQLRTQQIEAQLRTLTGKVEEIDFAVRQANDRLDRLIEDIDLRLRALEGTAGPGAASGSAPPAADPIVPAPPGTTVISSQGVTGPGAETAEGLAPGVRPLGRIRAEDLQDPAPGGGAGEAQIAASAPPAAPSVAPPPAGAGPNELYDHATRLLFAQDYAGAEAALQSFLDTHGDHALAGNAQYWLGETHYVREDYARAATVFLDSYQRFPDGNKAPDSLLKLALSLKAVGENDAACAALAQLDQNFPDAAVPIQRRAAQERGALGCA